MIEQYLWHYFNEWALQIPKDKSVSKLPTTCTINRLLINPTMKLVQLTVLLWENLFLVPYWNLKINGLTVSLILNMFQKSSRKIKV